MVRTQIADRGIRDARVLDAMRKVPRHEFVPEPFRQNAYEDHPLPIGEGQTISQPYIVAAMLEYLALQANDRVLEIGTGSGYVTALLSLLSAEVYSVERHAQLAALAESTLHRLEISQREDQSRRWQPGLGGVRAVRRRSGFGRYARNAACPVRSVARRRTIDVTGRPAFQSGAAIDPQSRRAA